jgi:ankyrin repeat protein
MKKYIIYLIALVALLGGRASAMEQPPQSGPITHEAVEKLKTFFPADQLDRIFGLTGYNELMLAIIMQDDARVKAIIKSATGQNHLGQRTNAGLTPLHFAAAFGNPEIARLLLSFGHTTLNELYPPLAFAAMRRDPSVLMAMLEMNKWNIDKALIEAIVRRNVASAYVLLCHGAQGLEGQLELIIERQLQKEAKEKNPRPELLEICRLLIMFGVYIPSGNDLEILTPLERAAYAGDANCVRKLISPSWWLFFRSRPTTEQLGRALAYARSHHQGYQEIETMLIEAGATLADVDNVARAILARYVNREDQRTPLTEPQLEWLNKLHQRIKRLQQAEQRICDARQPSTYLQLLPQPLFENVLRHYHGHEMLAETARRSLTDHDISNNANSSWRLISAVKDGNIDELKKWLEHFTADTRDYDGVPVLWHAYTSSHSAAVEIVNLLLERGAHPNPEVRGMHLTDGLTLVADPILITHRESITRLLRQHPHAGLHVRLILATHAQVDEAIRQLIRDADSNNALWDPTHMDMAYDFFIQQPDRYLNTRRRVFELLLGHWPHERLQGKLNQMDGVVGRVPVRIHPINRVQLVSNELPNRKAEKSAAEQIQLLIESIKGNSLTSVFDILSPGTLSIRDLAIDDMPVIEYLILRHNFENMQQARLMIDALVEHGVDFNPLRENRAFLDRLISDTNYRRYFSERPRVLWQLVEVLEKRGYECPQLRLRLTQILGIKPVDVMRDSHNSMS